MILCISAVSVVTSPFSFLILLIWVFSLFFLMSLANCLSIFFIFSESAFNFIDLCYHFLHFFFIYFWSDHYDFFPSANFGFFVLLSLLALGVRLGCLFEMFLVFKSQFRFQRLWLVCLYFLFLPGSVLRDCTFLRICPFLPGCPFYWHTVACSSLLWSFIFLWCQL